MDENGKSGEPAGIDVSSEHSDSWSDVTSSRVDIVQEKPAPIAGRQSGDVSSEVAIRRIQGLRILVLGNNPDQLTAVSEELGNLGVEVGVGTADSTGYRTALSFRPDVILSDLARPGDEGWWVVQRLRRHPLLRWSPVLLMKWWEVDEDGSGRILVPRVVERIADALTPLRVLEERIAAGRQLADRLEVIGAPGLVKVLNSAGLGVLTVNDAWNVFELRLERGAVISATRRGVDGEIDDGEDAFFQFLLCDVGRWSFRQDDAKPPVRNIIVPFAHLSSRAAVVADKFFGAPSRGARADVAFRVRPDLFRDLASTLKGVSRHVAEVIAAGVSVEELDSILEGEDDRQEVERGLAVFLRSGALLSVDKLGPVEPGSREERTVQLVEHLLAWISRDYEYGGVDSDEEVAGGTGTGFYRSSEVVAEKVDLGKAQEVEAPGSAKPLVVGSPELEKRDINATTPLANIMDDERPTPVIDEDDMAWGEVFPDGPADVDSRSQKAHPRDSLAPSPVDEPEERNRRQMWLAIGLAVLLAILLVAGLVAVGSGGRDHHGRDTVEE